MRNFIVSDLHGNGSIYDSIINYLSNELEYGNEPITLYINGDLIDRGVDSGSMLVDIYERINKKEGFNIKYLGGNHELMMYQTYNDTTKYYDDFFLTSLYSQYGDNWINYNGGIFTSRYLKRFYPREEIDKICEFIGNLDIYNVFDEKINDKNILLVHACACKTMEDKTKLKINDDKTVTSTAVWARRDDFLNYGFPGVGNENFFTIIGHTQVFDLNGYKYEELDNTLNIDGACAEFDYYNTRYLQAHKKYSNMLVEDAIIPFSEYDKDTLKKLSFFSHTPLVEIQDNKLKILTFNFKNEIIYGNYFEDFKSYPMDSNELNKCRNNLRGNTKIKERIRKIGRYE